MNRLHRYKTPLLTTILVTVFLIVPQLAFAGVVEGFFQEILWGILTTITGTILWICAMLFDFAVNTFVIGFGNLYLGSGIGVAVDRIWFILRDFVNMFFIFGLVYIGFKMILNSDDGNTRRWLVNLIIAAILINFSLLITKTVVDFSNQIATQIAISGFDAKEVTNDWGTTYETNLADYILGLMGIKDLLNSNLSAGAAQSGGWGYIFGTAIFFLVTAFVLAAGAFMLMIRFVVLTMFLLVSPLMFISWVLPPVSDTMQRYWKEFIGRAFFAPVYFLFLYFSLETLIGLQQSLGIADKGGAWAETFSKTADGNQALVASQTTLPYFFIMCGFMIASLVISKKLSKDGADWSQKMAGKATAGVLGRMGRNTIGRGANAIANSERLKDKAANGGFLSRSLARGAIGAGGYGAKASFDARGIPAVGKNKFVNPGEAQKGGYKKELDEKVKKEKERLKNLGEVDVEKEGKQQFESERARLKAEADALEDKARVDGEELDEDKEKTEDELVAAITALTEEIKKEEDALEDGIKNKTLTDKEQLESRASIAGKRSRLGAKQNNFDLSRASSDKERARLELSLAEANGANPQEQAEARDAMQKAEAAYEQELELRDSAVKAAKARATKDGAEAEARAKGLVKYSRQIAHMNRMRKSVWNEKFIGTRGGIVGGVATLAAGGAVLGFSEAGAYSAAHKEILKALEKEYGKDGVKKINSEKKDADEAKRKKEIDDAVKKATAAK